MAERLPKTTVVWLVAALAVSATVTADPVTAAPATHAPERPAAADVPVPGGTLNVLGNSDVDYLDANISYYSIGYSILRQFSRQLYSYPAVAGRTDRADPDLATDLPDISPDGMTYTIHIRPGVLWNTAPPRQVKAADLVRGVKMTCNPYQPFGGLYQLDTLIDGMADFCRGFLQAPTNARDIRRYVRRHDLAGVRVGGDPLTVIFTLTHPASYFVDMLATPAFSPRPRELMDFLPGSPQEAQHTISDGPYQVSVYRPARKLVFLRSPTWDATTDPIRAAYVDKIVIAMNLDPVAAQQQLQTGDPSADVYLGWMPDSAVEDRQAAGDPGLTLSPTFTTNPFVVFNTRSPNQDNALRHRKVRRALSYALGRNALLAALPGGASRHAALTHVLPAGIVGSEDFDLYPRDVDKAKSLLASAGAGDLLLKFLYRPSSQVHVALLDVIRQQLAEAGVTVKGIPATDADFYSKYLLNPRMARRGVWDVSLVGWGPDWYHEGAVTIIPPLFDSASIPPSRYNFGLLRDATLDGLIDQATAADEANAAELWHQADLRVMQDAAVYPIDTPLAATYHATQVHDFVYLPALQTGDFSNMWLDPAANGG